MRSWVKRVLTPPSTNYHLVDADLDPLALLPRGSILVDLGGGSARGQYAVTRTTAASKELRVLTVDLVRGASVDVQGDAHAIPLQSASVDGVFCVSVLEYVASPQAVVGEIHRVLKPGGIVYLSAPFVFPYHPPPDDRFRFSMAGLKALTAQFDPVKVGFNRGPASTFCHVLVHFVAVALSFGSAKIYGVLLDVSKWCLFWIKFLDRWIGRYPSAQVLHGSAYVLALKPKRQ